MKPFHLSSFLPGIAVSDPLRCAPARWQRSDVESERKKYPCGAWYNLVKRSACFLTQLVQIVLLLHIFSSHRAFDALPHDRLYSLPRQIGSTSPLSRRRAQQCLRGGESCLLQGKINPLFPTRRARKTGLFKEARAGETPPCILNRSKGSNVLN